MTPAQHTAFQEAIEFIEGIAKGPYGLAYAKSAGGLLPKLRSAVSAWKVPPQPNVTFDPIKTVDALEKKISRMLDYGKERVEGLTPCEAYYVAALEAVRDAIMAGIDVDSDSVVSTSPSETEIAPKDEQQREGLAPLA